VDDDATLRLGLSSIHGLRTGAVGGLVAARAAGPFASLDDFLRRTAFNAEERRALAGSGALNVLAGHRRAALWNVEAPGDAGDLFHGMAAEDGAPVPLRPMTLLERLQADYAHVSLTTGAHPMRLLRDRFPDLWPAAKLREARSGERVKVGGAVITRQRPGTAKGVCFITLEDETGFANAIVRPRLFEKERLVISLEPALVIAGRVQNEDGVIHVLADEITGMPPVGLPSQASHDFH
jgi:error-prone DNA polymerase